MLTWPHARGQIARAILTVFTFLNSTFFQIIDEKSLIKKYQREISILKEELDQLRNGMLIGATHEEIMTLRQKVLLSP